MQRKVALAGIGLFAGFGLGWAVGVHYPRMTPATVPKTVVGPARSIGASAAPKVDDGRAALAMWYAANCPWAGKAAALEHLAVWAEKDPRAALAWVSCRAHHSNYDHFLAVSLAWLCRQSPAETNDWILGNIKVAQRAKLARSVMYEVAGIAPHEAIAFAVAAGIELDIEYRTPILETLALTDPAEFAAMFSSLSPADQKRSASSIANHWARSDREGATRWCESLQGQPGEVNAIRGLLCEVAQQDPANVFEVFDRLSRTGGKMGSVAFYLTFHENGFSGMLPAIAGDLLASDPARTVELFKTHQRERAGECITKAWTSWRYSDRIAADAWAETINDPEVKAALVTGQLREAAKHDPAMLLSCLDANPSAEIEKKTIRDALLRVPRTDARKWIAAHPDLAEAESTSWITQRYLEDDHSAAVAWVDSLPVGENKDQALAQVALSDDESTNIGSATAALEAITNPALRTTVTFKLYSSLHAKDKRTAESWLAGQPIPLEIRANWETISSAKPSLVFAPQRPN